MALAILLATYKSWWPHQSPARTRRSSQFSRASICSMTNLLLVMVKPYCSLFRSSCSLPGPRPTSPRAERTPANLDQFSLVVLLEARSPGFELVPRDF